MLLIAIGIVGALGSLAEHCKHISVFASNPRADDAGGADADILDLRAGGVLRNLQCDQKWICGEKCADRRRRREMAREKKQREDQEAARMALEAARVARERKQREEQDAADRMARERKRRREEQEMEDQARKRREIAEKIESPKKQCNKDKKLYYHCVFSGINNTCFWAPLGEGARTYGEVYKCGKVIAE
jgi:hypothetical protein